MIDFHAHISDSIFDQDRDKVIHQAQQAGVKTIIAVSENIKNNPENWHMDKMNNDSTNIVMEPVTPDGEEIWMM